MTISMTDVGGAKELGIVQMKAFRLRRDITLYADKAQQQPVFNIKARQAVALNHTFDVNDPQSGQPIFAFVPETYTISTTGDQPQSIGAVVHKKNPFIVKMSLDTSQAQTDFDPRIAIASCVLLSIRDASKNG